MLHIGLNIKGKNILIIGGGKIGERRLIKFLKFQANVTIISPQFTKKIEELAINNTQINLIEENVTLNSIEKYLKNIFLASIVTDDFDFNMKMAKIIQDHGILVNLAHHSEIADVMMAATIDYGEFTIGILTHGKSPLFAKLLKEKFQRTISLNDLHWLKIQVFAREKAKEKIPSAEVRGKFLNNLFNDPAISENIEKGLIENAKQLILNKLEEI